MHDLATIQRMNAEAVAGTKETFIIVCDTEMSRPLFKVTGTVKEVTELVDHMEGMSTYGDRYTFLRTDS